MHHCSGLLDQGEFVTDPVFGFEVPTSCPGIPDELLQPSNTWADPAEHGAKAKELAQSFAENFANYADRAGPGVAEAGPSV